MIPTLDWYSTVEATILSLLLSRQENGDKKIFLPSLMYGLDKAGKLKGGKMNLIPFP